jgi:ABC-type multidrug transport system fused ATPase/permease subunit
MVKLLHRRLFYHGPHGNRIISLCVLFTAAALVADTYVVGYSTFTWSTYDQSMYAFVIIALISIAGQYFLLDFIKHKSEEIRSRRRIHLHIIHKAVTLVNYTVLAIFVFVLLQMLVSSYYNLIGVISALTISYSLAVAMMALLAYQFLSWFKSNRNYVVLLYGLAAAALSVNTGLTLGLISIVSPNLPAEIHMLAGSFRPSFTPGSLTALLNTAYTISSIVSFTITWIASTLLLHHYSRKLGNAVYWIIIGIPLVYFLGQFLYLFINPFSFLNTDPFSYGVLLMTMFLLSKPAGGFLFGFAFLDTARKLDTGPVRDYMIISAYGFMLFFISNQAAIVLPVISYPPFGLATTLFTGLSSYFIMVGIYSSAISISEDSELRRSIRKFAIKESKLLDSIGFAHMEQEIQKRALKLAKVQEETMKEQTGIGSSLDEDDMKDYLKEVINEVKKHHQQ